VVNVLSLCSRGLTVAQAWAQLQEANRRAEQWQQEAEAHRQDAEWYRGILPQIVQCLAVSQTLPHDLPAFCFSSDVLPPPIPAVRNMIARHGSPHLLRVSQMLRVAHAHNTELTAINRTLRADLDRMRQSLERAESHIARMEGGGDYITILEQALQQVNRQTLPFTRRSVPRTRQEYQDALLYVHIGTDLHDLRQPWLPRSPRQHTEWPGHLLEPDASEVQGPAAPQ
jgi:hypothetical protein